MKTSSQGKARQSTNTCTCVVARAGWAAAPRARAVLIDDASLDPRPLRLWPSAGGHCVQLSCLRVTAHLSLPCLAKIFLRHVWSLCARSSQSHESSWFRRKQWHSFGRCALGIKELVDKYCTVCNWCWKYTVTLAVCYGKWICRSAIYLDYCHKKKKNWNKYTIVGVNDDYQFYF